MTVSTLTESNLGNDAIETSPTTLGKSLLLGLSVGFALGWISRRHNLMASSNGILRNLAAISRYTLRHGKVPQTKLVLVVRTDIEMTRGKICSQVSHAAVGTVQNFHQDRSILNIWLRTGQPKVVLRAKDEGHLMSLAKSAQVAGINTFLVKDAGRTEVEPGTTTVLAVGPGKVSDINQITGSLKLL